MTDAPIVKNHEGVYVVRDDLFAGGTKARFLPVLFKTANELVYATPAQGGAQTALAHTAAKLGKRVTLFVAKRAQPHDRTLEAKRLGAKVFQVNCGYLKVVQSRARSYCADTGATLVPFGVRLPEAIETIAGAARSLAVKPDEIWCASGSGVLATALRQAWPNAEVHCVQVGRELKPADAPGAIVHVYPQPFDKTCKTRPPFPSDPHYDAKAWEMCLARKRGRVVLFWNVTGPATP